MEHYISIKGILASIIYSFIGVAILAVCFVLLEKLTPENIWREVMVNRNMALAVILAAFILAIAIIVAAAVHG